MIILPAIDLQGGRCVRLRKGDFHTTEKVADDPLATARNFIDAGAKWIHMVDLDAAKSGKRTNGRIVYDITQKTGLHVELGGGLRTMEDLEAADDMGVSRMVIGSAAVKDPAFVKAAVEKYGIRIAVGIDARNGKVATSGWLENTDLDYIAFAQEMEKLGVQNLIYTDINTDGMLKGPSFRDIEKLLRSVSVRVTASGGVSCNGDLTRLHKLGVYGAIVGKAYYAGKVDLKAAIEEGGPQNAG